MTEITVVPDGLKEIFAVHFVGFGVQCNDPSVKEVFTSQFWDSQDEAEKQIRKWNSKDTGRIIVQTNYGQMMINLDLIIGMRPVQGQIEKSSPSTPGLLN